MEFRNSRISGWTEGQESQILLAIELMYFVQTVIFNPIVISSKSRIGFIPHDFRCGICGIPLRYHRCELRATNHAEYRKFTATTATSFAATYRNRYEYFHSFFCIFR